MLRIIRAEDGQDFQLNASLRDIETSGSLEDFLHHAAGVEPDAVLAYISDGQRLTNTNLRELAGSPDQTIYLFNKHYLDYDIDHVLAELRINAPALPPIEETISATPPFRPAQLATSYLRTAHVHNESVFSLTQSIICQSDALQIASRSLDLNVLAILDIFDSVATMSRQALDKQAVLLAGINADLDIIGRVKVHVDFVSTNARKAIEAGDKSRTLGDYVSNVKMMQVAETCGRTHEDLRRRFDTIEDGVANLKQGADEVREIATGTRQLEATDLCRQQSQETYDRIAECAVQLEGLRISFISEPPNRTTGPNNQSDVVLQELKDLDRMLREKLQRVTDIKNGFTEECITVLRRISVLNAEMAELPPQLMSLQASFRGKNSFLHIQRLHNMLYAYGATVIEIVRRKEFARFFYQRAQSILEVMAKLSVSERKRRQIYRSELHGQLPFETRGMDDPVPTIDFSPIGNADNLYTLERADVDALLRFVDELGYSLQAQNDTIAFTAVRECRTALDKLVLKMDGIEAGFDKIAERSLLSSSRMSMSRRRPSVADEQTYNQLLEQVQSLEHLKDERDHSHEAEKQALQDELARTKAELSETRAALRAEQDQRDSLERDLHHAKAVAESESTSRRILQDRLTEVTKEADNRRAVLEKVLADGTEQTKAMETLRQELAQVRADYEGVKEMEAQNSRKMTNLLDEQSITLKRLEEARARGDDLRLDIQTAQAENERVNKTLQEVGKEKDRLLRAQAIEHDRIIRDHMVEMDGDRAILEHQFSELKAVYESAQEQLRDALTDAEVAHTDAIGLREELQRVEHELREARHIERMLRNEVNDRKDNQLDIEHRLETNERLLASILDVALTFRSSHVKALNSTQASIAHPNRQSMLSESVFSGGLRHSIIGQPEEPSPIDPSDPAGALEILRSYDHDHFQEVIGKSGSTIRKWQKQCKEYRERSKGKISFRNFAKGDLALFLPTRNSISKPWAAFNVSFPHYFLQAKGHLAEQLKTREWIVARITSITERVVNQNDPSSNPYGLGDGVKYYMLEVEDWTQPTSQKRHTSRRVASSNVPPPTNEPKLASSAPDLPSGPPEDEVEEAFRVTRPPTSHLFPVVRNRSSSSPSARPSSLSRLLAQASADASTSGKSSVQANTPPSSAPSATTAPSDSAASSTTAAPSVPVQLLTTAPPSITTSPSIATAPSTATIQPPSPITNHPAIEASLAHASPLRPGSRASRVSTTSRYSAGLIPSVGSTSSGHASIPKAIATTAITGQPILSTSPTSQFTSVLTSETPSPRGSVSDGLAGIFGNSRRRVTSFHSPLGKTSLLSPTLDTTAEATPHARAGSTSSALANLASWGVSLGRRRRSGALDPVEDQDSSS